MRIPHFHYDRQLYKNRSTFLNTPNHLNVNNYEQGNVGGVCGEAKVKLDYPYLAQTSSPCQEFLEANITE